MRTITFPLSLTEFRPANMPYDAILDGSGKPLVDLVYSHSTTKEDQEQIREFVRTLLSLKNRVESLERYDTLRLP
jgi:hypothetical protein